MATRHVRARAQLVPNRNFQTLISSRSSCLNYCLSLEQARRCGIAFAQPGERASAMRHFETASFHSNVQLPPSFFLALSCSSKSYPFAGTKGSRSLPLMAPLAFPYRIRTANDQLAAPNAVPHFPSSPTLVCRQANPSGTHVVDLLGAIASNDHVDLPRGVVVAFD
ncbi:uncharacterized protein BKA78DRAFT_61572 [Phyllosticta capitalensis]|uniref:uncharacterized protein n=1 Tax=Phyllosticta capitalensis TaxID=121624 RepID=UPI0031321074